MAAVLAAMVIGSLPGTASAAARITFGVDWWGLQLHSECIRGHAAPDAPVRVTWKSAGGALKTRVDLVTASNGYWSYCSETAVLLVGDTIKAADEIGSRTFTMPKVTLLGDRINDRFFGRAPANAVGNLYWHAGTFADYYAFATVNSNPDGTWSAQPEDLGDLIGGIEAFVDFMSPMGDWTRGEGTTPYVEVTIGRSALSGGASSHQAVMITLRDPVTGVIEARGSDVADVYGSFAAEFRNDQEQPVAVQVGDRIRSKLAADMNWLVPDVQIGANVANDVVQGRCFDNGLAAHYGIARVYRGPQVIGFAIFNTELDGTFEIDFSGQPAPFYNPANIRRGDRIGIECALTTGDLIRKFHRVP